MNTTYWLNNIMSTMYTNNATGFYVGLSSSAPSVAGTGFTEPSGGNYSRVKVASFTAPTNGVVKNSAAITFPQSSQTWFESDAKAAYWLLFDGSGASAKLLSWGALDEPKTIESNTTITIAANTLSVTLTDYSA